MAFFKLRREPASDSDDASHAGQKQKREPAETVETLRRRARHRLVGAVVLVLAAVVGFPLLFETEPRPGPVSAQITIPDQNHVAPLAVPQVPHGDVPAQSSLGINEAVVPPATVAAGSVKGQAPQQSATTAAQPAEAPGSAVIPAGATPQAPVIAAPAAETAEKETPEPRTKREVKREDDKAGAAAETKNAVAAKKAASAEAKRADAARALAALQGRSSAGAAAPTAADNGRFIVQVGAFSDAGKATNVRREAQRLGFKSYTQALKTRDGGLATRVRVGPFATRAEAEHAAAALKRAGLPTQIVTL